MSRGHTIAKVLIALCLGVCLLLPTMSRSQEPLDGPKRILRDDLLDNLAGHWMLTRKIRGKEIQNSVDAEWVLNHQFLQVHMKDLATPPAYEALIFMGYDNTSERYVVHWIDVYGGRTSETLGYGKRNGTSMPLVFEYPDGPFHNTLTWDGTAKTWVFSMEHKNASGQWVPFGEDTLRRVP
jgi:hypothetical protein